MNRIDPEIRFWSHVEQTPTCWLWTAYTDKDGYGMFWLGKTFVRAHRFGYELAKGPIPDGLVLDHLKEVCTHRNCVRFDHLEPVTTRENLMRSSNQVAQFAIATECFRGHPLDYLSPKGIRGCKTCRADANRRVRERAHIRRPIPP